jgi:polar amino acid transport system substrate-binding protein
VQHVRKLFFFLIVVSLLSPVALASDRQANEVYDRVVKTHTLHCAYTTYPTFVEKDPNTGAFSGMFYDLVNEVGRQLGIKVEWTEEVGSDAIFEGFKTGRYDAVCPGYFAAPSRTWGGDFTKPIVFIPFDMWVRAGEKRFKSFDDFNNQRVTVATLDGEMSQIATNESFPLATQKSLSGLTPATDRFVMVATGKADATPMEAAIGAEYMKNNPGKIMPFGTKPIRLGGSTIIIPHDEFKLKEMLDTAIDSMLWTGAIERIIRKHEKYPGTMMLPAQPYQPESRP